MLPRAAAQCNGVLPEKSIHSTLVSGWLDKIMNGIYIWYTDLSDQETSQW